MSVTPTSSKRSSPQNNLIQASERYYLQQPLMLSALQTAYQSPIIFQNNPFGKYPSIVIPYTSDSIVRILYFFTLYFCYEIAPSSNQMLTRQQLVIRYFRKFTYSIQQKQFRVSNSHKKHYNALHPKETKIFVTKFLNTLKQRSQLTKNNKRLSLINELNHIVQIDMVLMNIFHSLLRFKYSDSQQFQYSQESIKQGLKLIGFKNIKIETQDNQLQSKNVYSNQTKIKWMELGSIDNIFRIQISYMEGKTIFQIHDLKTNNSQKGKNIYKVMSMLNNSFTHSQEASQLRSSSGNHQYHKDIFNQEHDNQSTLNTVEFVQWNPYQNMKTIHSNHQTYNHLSQVELNKNQLNKKLQSINPSIKSQISTKDRFRLLRQHGFIKKQFEQPISKLISNQKQQESKEIIAKIQYSQPPPTTPTSKQQINNSQIQNSSFSKLAQYFQSLLQDQQSSFNHPQINTSSKQQQSPINVFQASINNQQIVNNSLNFQPTQVLHSPPIIKYHHKKQISEIHNHRQHQPQPVIKQSTGRYGQLVNESITLQNNILSQLHRLVNKTNQCKNIYSPIKTVYQVPPFFKKQHYRTKSTFQKQPINYSYQSTSKNIDLLPLSSKIGRPLHQTHPQIINITTNSINIPMHPKNNLNHQHIQHSFQPSQVYPKHIKNYESMQQPISKYQPIIKKIAFPNKPQASIKIQYNINNSQLGGFHRRSRSDNYEVIRR